MCKLEYRVSTTSPMKDCEHEKFLNKMGKEGWRLCAIIIRSWDAANTHYFCREVQPTAIQLEQEAGDSAFVNKKCGSQLYW